MKDSVVRVTAGWSGGTGFIFDVESQNAFIVTSYHVVKADEDGIDVKVKNAQTYRAFLLGYDSDRDIAVLSICCSSAFFALTWEAEVDTSVGQEVIAIGYPLSAQSSVIATRGEVGRSDVTSRLYDFIPHSAPLNPGSSGGPLFSMEGTVLGVNTARSVGKDTPVYYAVPYFSVSDQIAEWKSQLVVMPSETPDAPVTPEGITISGEGDGSDFVTLEAGKYVVTATVVGNEHPNRFISEGTFRIEIESLGGTDSTYESWQTTGDTYRFTLDINDDSVRSYERDLYVGEQLISVEAEGSWTITFKKV